MWTTFSSFNLILVQNGGLFCTQHNVSSTVSIFWKCSIFHLQCVNNKITKSIITLGNIWQVKFDLCGLDKLKYIFFQTRFVLNSSVSSIKRLKSSLSHSFVCYLQTSSFSLSFSLDILLFVYSYCSLLTFSRCWIIFQCITRQAACIILNP